MITCELPVDWRYKHKIDQSSDWLSKVSQSSLIFISLRWVRVPIFYIWGPIILPFLWNKCKCQHIQPYIHVYRVLLSMSLLVFTIMPCMLFFHLLCSFNYTPWPWLLKEVAGSGEGRSGLECLLFPFILLPLTPGWNICELEWWKEKSNKFSFGD